MKKLLVGISIVMLAGCGNVKDITFNGKNTDEILEKIKKSKDMTGEENSLLSLAMTRYSLENKTLEGKRVGDLIIEQKKLTAEFSKYLDQVTNKMKDPESARFKNLKMNMNNACGEVNGKNSNGGYVGYRRFFIENGGYAVIEGGDFNGYVLEKLKYETEILQELISRKKSGDKTNHSDSEIKEMVIQRTFDNVYNKMCGDQAKTK